MVGFTTGFGTAPPATGGSEAGPRGEEGFYQHFGTAPPATCGSEVFPRAEASPNQPQPVSILYPCRSSARGPLPQVPQGHPGVAMGAPDRVFIHEMGLSHGRRGPGRAFGHHRLSLPSSPERPSMTRGSDSSKVEPRKTTSGDLISIIRRSNAQSQLKASTIS